MSKRQFQKIYRSTAVEQLRIDLRSGTSLKSYFEEVFPIKEKDLHFSNIEITAEKPKLKMPESDPATADLENAIALHEYYKNLDETKASDPRLWVYLSHVEFREYTLSRWGLKGAYEDLKDDEAKSRAINQILEHWFANGGDLKGLRRHSLARLWWAAHLTYAPWERDPEFFADIKKEDPYYYTTMLLYTQDIYQQVLERGMGRSSRILISILEYLDKNKTFADLRENVRRLEKELNLVYGAKKIITLNRTDLADLVAKTAEEILQQE